MIYSVYSVRDDKTTFAGPFLDSSDNSAKRGFYYAFNNGKSMLNFSPEDFALYRIGTFDADTGILSPCVVPEFICRASDFRRVDGGVEFEE